MDKSKIAQLIISHPDKDELVVKCLSGTSNKDIYEWLSAKYCGPGEDKFVISEKNISIFKKDYLDFYVAMQEDIAKTKHNLTAEQELKLQIQGNPSYHQALEKYVNNEIDVKLVVKRLIAAIETRAAQVWETIAEDPRNLRNDRTLREWLDSLANILEKYDTILNGNPEQINIQNNINIQVVDDHINVIYNIIKEILENLDHDASILFIERFAFEMQRLKQQSLTASILPQDVRLSEAIKISEDISNKL